MTTEPVTRQFRNLCEARKRLMSGDRDVPWRQRMQDDGSYELSLAMRQEYMRIHGLKETKGRHCLRRVLGKQCVSGNGRKHYPGIVSECLPHFPPYADHVHVFCTADNSILFTSQPYDWNEEKEAKTKEFCDKYKISYRVNPEWSFHNPGSTTLIEYYSLLGKSVPHSKELKILYKVIEGLGLSGEVSAFNWSDGIITIEISESDALPGFDSLRDALIHVLAYIPIAERKPGQPRFRDCGGMMT
jgi:hypothetical protein